MGYAIDIDTGGTFTDGFFVCGHRVESVKVPTTPHDLTVCFLNCIEAGAARFGTQVEDLLYETEVIRFSNTIHRPSNITGPIPTRVRTPHPNLKAGKQKPLAFQQYIDLR